jgi:hypothetical protein
MRRQDAVDAVEGRCPRCGATRDGTQQYCVECGLRLPPVRGLVAGLRRRWLRRLGWYPGDWIWVSLLTLVVAIAGAAAAIAFGGSSSSAAATTSIAPTPRPADTFAAAPLPTAPEETTSTAATTPAAHVNGLASWPPGRSGWTIVLFSYPATAGTDAPYATAARAARAGLREVGVIHTDQFASLHPGYYVVFSGVYSSAGEAEAALRTARVSGFTSAYTRQISR